jgi:SPP1 family predicted phage head-tail adaptor
MQAGELRQRVTIEVRAKKSDGSDGVTEVWSPVCRRIAAKVEPLAGKELDHARQIDPRAGHQVSVRYWNAYRVQFTARSRIVYHDGGTNRILEPVEPIREVEERETLQVICREAA